VLLFFRHGTTPTANRLSQQRRKGSMSAPAGAPWTRAVEMAHEGLAAMQHEAQLTGSAAALDDADPTSAAWSGPWPPPLRRVQHYRIN